MGGPTHPIRHAAPSQPAPRLTVAARWIVLVAGATAAATLLGQLG